MPQDCPPLCHFQYMPLPDKPRDTSYKFISSTFIMIIIIIMVTIIVIIMKILKISAPTSSSLFPGHLRWWWRWCKKNKLINGFSNSLAKEAILALIRRIYRHLYQDDGSALDFLSEPNLQIQLLTFIYQIWELILKPYLSRWWPQWWQRRILIFHP